MDDARDVAAVQRLAQGFPLEAATSPGAGVLWLASRDLRVGDVVLEARPYASVVTHSLARSVCAVCFAPVDKRARRSWPECSCGQVVFCSAACAARAGPCAWETHHGADECRALRRLANVRAGTYDDVEMTELRLLVRVLCRAAAERSGELAPGPADHTYADVCSLASNMQAYRTTRPKLHERIAAKVRTLQALLRKTRVLRGVGEEEVEALVCREQCNTYGVWSKAHKLHGISLYPCGSFFNHSCAPAALHRNTGTLLRVVCAAAVPAGAPVTISYVPLVENTAQRRRALLEDYCFTCQCGRCAAQSQGGPDAEWARMSAMQCPRRECVGLVMPGTNPPECSLCGVLSPRTSRTSSTGAAAHVAKCN
eukprot:m51a1_g1020 hypothetical protein (368) ;mRNA; f:641415-643363